MADTIGEAEEYELFGHPDTTAQDCAFLADLFAATGRDIQALLDIACGTGRHAIAMAKQGYDVTGIDLSLDMLNVARERAAAKGVNVTLLRRDMQALDFQGAFDAAYILFNTFTLLTRNDQLITFLQGVHRALKPEGLFILEVGNLWSYIAEGKFSNSAFEADEEHAGIKRHTKLDMVVGPHNNVYRMHRLMHYWRDGEPLAPRTEDLVLRAFSYNELDLLFRMTGFEVLQLFGATALEAVIEDPHRIEAIEDPYHSCVLLTIKRGIQYDHFTELADLKRQRDDQSRGGLHPRGAKRIPGGARGYSGRSRRPGWQRRRRDLR